MSARTRLGVIFGGRSPEHEVSVVSGRSIMREADPERFEVVPFGITRGGAWLTPQETLRRIDRLQVGEYGDLGDEDEDLLSFPDVLASLATIDVAFPIVHGRSGEDGSLQGLLEVLDIPYVGAGVAASAIGMDKAHMRAVLTTHDIPQPTYVVIEGDELADLAGDAPPRESLAGIERTVGYPSFAKPANGGSSIGVSKVASREDLGPALELAARYDGKVLLEEAIEGSEVECAMLGNADPRPSPLGEIRPHDEFYTYEAKYQDDSTDLIVPADLSDGLATRVQDAAVRAYHAIGCSGLARVDFMVREPDTVRLIEVNTLPGFTPISMYPRLWGEAGVDYASLITRLVDLGLERHTEVRSYA
ncbi:MAG: D-alanine--D-alanine ligase [Chloroflexi bacterium]|nr:D-alanine--D-alanine ligase [Chloroflexota bacterium]